MRSLVAIVGLWFGDQAIGADTVTQPAGPPDAAQYSNYEDWRAATLIQKNQNKDLPSLDFRGYKTNYWGEEWRIPEAAPRSCEFLGLPCRMIRLPDPKTNFLNGIRFSVSGLTTNRVDRLEAYNRLRSQLEAEYRAAASEPQPRVSVLGADAYVKGLRHAYSCEWLGPETRVVLELNQQDVSVVFEALRPESAARRAKSLEASKPRRADH